MQVACSIRSHQEQRKQPLRRKYFLRLAGRLYQHHSPAGSMNHCYIRQIQGLGRRTGRTCIDRQLVRHSVHTLPEEAREQNLRHRTEIELKALELEQSHIQLLE